MTARLAAEPVLAAGAALGECPVWDGERGRLRWIDATRGELHATCPGSGADSRARLGERIGSIAPRRGGGLLAAVDGEILLLDREDEVEARLPGPWGPGAAVNDGACDGAGRFWVGAVRAAPELGAVFRVDPDGGSRQAFGGVVESNGIGFSPAGDVLYHVDSGRGTVDALELAPASGELGARRRLLDVAPAAGLPDGLAVDREGAVWVAIWGAGEVRRYDRRGELLAVVALPVSHVTSCCFGGPGLDVLWITTARGELSAAELAAQPLAGALFRADPGLPGLPPAAFGA